MTSITLALRGLRFHARSHLGAVLGAAVGSAVLVGALVVGDSVRDSLRDMALARLGATEFALAGSDRFFRAELADGLAQKVHAPMAPLIQILGTAATADGSARANRVQVLGVNEKFWGFGAPPEAVPGPEEVALNQSLAEQLMAKVGDRILLRVDKPSQLSRDAPISPQDDYALALRVTVRAIVRDDQMGRFSLQASQVPPFNAFVPSAWLAERLQLSGRANLMLAGSAPDLSQDQLHQALVATWQLADAELELRATPATQAVELRTSRVFLDPAVGQAAMNLGSNATGVLTYFVNELRIGSHATPYSMVTATGALLVPAEMRDDEILIDQWLADDLAAKPGDSLALTYFVIGAARRLEERTNQFKVRAVVPLAGLAADPSLMPDFPGLEKAESTRDWDSSLPIKLERIRTKDEEFWKQHRGTPKAFLTLSAGQKMWANRFGNLTAVRFPAGTDQRQLAESLRSALDPAAIGLAFQPVRQQALAASDQAQDFGQLFLGFSFFLIVAALLLMALLFQFGIEKRAGEVGTLLALGFTPKQVRRLLLWEGIGLAMVGAAIGVPAGIGYAKAMLYGLSTIWRSAVGTSGLQYHAHGSTLACGALAGVVVAVLTIYWGLRKQARQPARELLAESGAIEPALTLATTSLRRNRGLWVGWLASALAMLLLGAAGLQEQNANPEVFFFAGTLLLTSGLGFAAAFLSALGMAESAQRPTLAAVGLRNATRRRRRSLATIGLLACGSFLVASIGVFRLDTGDAARKRSSGTGGFTLIGEATLPIVQDLNSPQGRQALGLSDTDLQGVRAVSFRVRDGEDASCLNLNRAQRPRLLAVRPEALSERHAFTFTQVIAGEMGNPWLLLNRHEPDGSVPAIGDAASIQWALGKKVGDVIPFTDERGRPFNLKLVGAVANSILQGNLIIAEREFLKRFPSESGYRLFLLDVQPDTPTRTLAVEAALSRAAQDYGMQLTTATRRLAAFNAVQNTYLNTFQILGGLGLLLGSVGLGVVVLRNVLERRGELALLLALGFRGRGLRWLVLSEHGALLLLGLGIGVISAFVAVLPALLTPGAQLPFASLGWTLAAVFGSGALWTWLATQLALRGQLLDALRNE